MLSVLFVLAMAVLFYYVIDLSYITVSMMLILYCIGYSSGTPVDCRKHP